MAGLALLPPRYGGFKSAELAPHTDRVTACLAHREEVSHPLSSPIGDCEPESPPHSDPSEGCTDSQFLFMLNAYRGSGGLARDGELLALAGHRCGLNADTLVGLIADREVIGFEWESRFWFPAFQFNLRDMTRPPALGQVLAELTPVYGSWERVNWFAQPNAWLMDHAPADRLQHDPSAVLQAARAERFIASS